MSDYRYVDTNVHTQLNMAEIRYNTELRQRNPKAKLLYTTLDHMIMALYSTLANRVLRHSGRKRLYHHPFPEGTNERLASSRMNH